MERGHDAGLHGRFLPESIRLGMQGDQNEAEEGSLIATTSPSTPPSTQGVQVCRVHGSPTTNGVLLRLVTAATRMRMSAADLGYEQLREITALSLQNRRVGPFTGTLLLVGKLEPPVPGL